MKKDLRILGELRKGPLAGMNEDEFKMIEADVKKFGIKGLSGYAKSMVLEAQRRLGFQINKAVAQRKTELDKHGDHDQSDHGAWSSGGSGPSTGDAYASSARNKVDNAYETIRDSAEFAKIPNSEKAKGLIDETFMALQRAQSLKEPLPKLREAQSASALLQELKTDFLDKMDASSKTKFLGFTSEIKGAIRDTDKLQDKILSNFDDEGNKINKATSVSVGDMVSWNASGGRAEGKVLRIARSGRINVPDSSFNIQATEEDPAALIVLYRDGKPTDTKVGHKVSTLKKK